MGKKDKEPKPEKSSKKDKKEKKEKKEKKDKKDKKDKTNEEAVVAEASRQIVDTTNWTLNDFQRMITLGTGTFGRVFLVTHRETGKYYAMKVLRKSLVVRLKQVQHVNNEKEILIKSKDCPFVVGLHKHFKDKKNLYFMLEYAVGGELFAHLRTAGKFKPDLATFYAAEIVLVLEYLHQRKIIYRDLKPENILVDREGHVKLTDFGFAKVVPDNRTFTLCGTPEYLAPEVIKGKGHGTEVDWWALGILIFEMLAGYPPFYDENPFGIYEKILLGRLSFPFHFDSNARDLIKKLLTQDRTRRLGSLKDGAEDVKRHKFFKNIDWDALARKQFKPPFVPETAHEGDTSNFDDYEEEPGYDVCDDPSVVDIYEETFADF